MLYKHNIIDSDHSNNNENYTEEKKEEEGEVEEC